LVASQPEEMREDKGTSRMSTVIDRRTALRFAAAATAALGVSAIPHVARSARVAGPHTVEPGAGAWRTWFLTSGADLRPPPPPDSRGELDQVRGLIGGGDTRRLDRIAFWDAGGPPYRWNELATDLAFQNAFGTTDSAVYARVQAYLNMAIHDATVATWDAKYAYSRPRPSQLDAAVTSLVAVPGSPAYPSEHAAAGSAAAEVLAYFAPKRADKLRAMAEEAARSREWAGVQYPSDTAAGMDIGVAVAKLAIAAAQSDNYDTATWDGTIPEGPGLWKGTNPRGAADRFWKTLIAPSADALRPPPPPAFDSPGRAQEVEAVKNFPRTPNTNALATFYQYQLRGAPNFNIIYNRDISRRVFEEHLEDSPLPARVYALLHATYQDAWITTQDCKFTYWTARPSMFDPSITTLFPNPNHPSYVSNASALATSPALVLAHFFPSERDALLERANEYGDSRLWAGIHFPSDIEVSRQMGEQLAALAIARDGG
jgi:membrane-associated phospholipid phosphatase